MTDWLKWLLTHPVTLLSLGGAVGTNARYSLGRAFPATPAGFPWSTFFINVSGSFCFGLAVVLMRNRLSAAHVHWFLLAGTGFCGGFTTFSTFSYETLDLVQQGQVGLALAYVLGSVLAGFAAAALAVGLAQLLA